MNDRLPVPVASKKLLIVELEAERPAVAEVVDGACDELVSITLFGTEAYLGLNFIEFFFYRASEIGPMEGVIKIELPDAAWVKAKGKAEPGAAPAIIV